MKRYARFVLSILMLALIGDLTYAITSQEAQKLPSTQPQPEPAPKAVKCWVTAVQPKPLSQNVRRGLEWLVAHQHANGGWGQGEESKNMGQGMARLAAKPNVADTCAAVLALIRSGSTPSEGSYAQSIHRGLDFIFSQIEAADEPSLSITSVHGTRVQGKLGPHIDTFMASIVLAEVKGHMPNEASEKRLFAALDKVLNKIEINQKDDGTWGNQGWAPILAQSMAAKGLSRAAQAGFEVDDMILAKTEAQAREQVDGAGAGFDAPGSAGVALYAGASNLSTLQDSANRNRQRVDELEKIAANSPDDTKRDEARRELDRFADAEVARQRVQQSIVGRLEDKQFMAGFGSNGGEEFLSYMNIGESLVVKGGDDWAKWDGGITQNLNRIQNADGSWSGHHCITGKTFCTSTALLSLMVDRTPVPADALTNAQ